MDKEVFENIIAAVIDNPQSPYHRLMDKVNDIDVDYFENITRDENTLSPELNLALKQTVVENVDEIARQLLYDSGLSGKITFDILDQLKNKEHYRQILLDTANKLQRYAKDRLLFIPTQKHDDVELNKLYEQAKEVTLLEHVMQNNRMDIIAFYRALMEQTEWECKALVEKRISQFIALIADKIGQAATKELYIQHSKYTPRTANTDDIKLPEDLAGLVELMAKNVHEIWAATRIKQGWTYGPERDDKQRKHPCLVPYEELPEEEKIYDRNTSTETLKLIMKLGFEISRNG